MDIISPNVSFIYIGIIGLGNTKLSLIEIAKLLKDKYRFVSLI